MSFPGIYDNALIAIDFVALSFASIFGVLYHRYHKPVWLVISTVFTIALIELIVLTIWLWSFVGWG